MKGERSKQYQKYLYQLAGEQITGTREETYQNGAMLRGIEMEAEARKLYEMLHDVEVEQVGLCFQDDKMSFGASPDGLVGDDGLVEFKCPILSTIVEYALKGNLVSDYFQQLQGQLLVTGRKWVDAVAYYPNFPPIIVRVERDEKLISALEKELGLFCQELLETVTKLKGVK
jgi:hypothetical protein